MDQIRQDSTHGDGGIAKAERHRGREWSGCRCAYLPVNHGDQLEIDQLLLTGCYRSADSASQYQITNHDYDLIPWLLLITKINGDFPARFPTSFMPSRPLNASERTIQISTGSTWLASFTTSARSWPSMTKSSGLWLATPILSVSRILI